MSVIDYAAFNVKLCLITLTENTNEIVKLLMKIYEEL